MKFIHYLEKIGGVSIYPIASLAIFGIFFLLMLLLVYKTDKQTIREISRIPLDEVQH